MIRGVAAIKRYLEAHLETRARERRRRPDRRTHPRGEGRRTAQPRRDGGDGVPAAVRRARDHHPSHQRVGVRAFAKPRLRDWLAEDWSRADLAVEEFLRFISPVQFSKPRFVRKDTELCGVPLRKGDKIMAMLAAANLDPAANEHPERLDLDKAAEPARRVRNRHPFLPRPSARPHRGPLRARGVCSNAGRTSPWRSSHRKSDGGGSLACELSRSCRSWIIQYDCCCLDCEHRGIASGCGDHSHRTANWFSRHRRQRSRSPSSRCQRARDWQSSGFGDLLDSGSEVPPPSLDRRQERRARRRKLGSAVRATGIFGRLVLVLLIRQSPQEGN